MHKYRCLNGIVTSLEKCVKVEKLSFFKYSILDLRLAKSLRLVGCYLRYDKYQWKYEIQCNTILTERPHRKSFPFVDWNLMKSATHFRFVHIHRNKYRNRKCIELDINKCNVSILGGNPSMALTRSELGKHDRKSNKVSAHSFSLVFVCVGCVLFRNLNSFKHFLRQPRDLFTFDFRKFFYTFKTFNK